MIERSRRIDSLDAFETSNYYPITSRKPTNIIQFSPCPIVTLRLYKLHGPSRYSTTCTLVYMHLYRTVWTRQWTVDLARVMQRMCDTCQKFDFFRLIFWNIYRFSKISPFTVLEKNIHTERTRKLLKRKTTFKLKLWL